MTERRFTRREFLGTVTAGLAMGAAFGRSQEHSPNGIPVRPLGNTGEKVSIIGLGGHDVLSDNTDDEAINLIEKALDNGITFFDNSWDYHSGHAEEVMGEVLKDPVKRDKVFLMTKVCGRSYETAKQHLEDSLRRLRTDMIDLWQFHGIRWEEDPDLIFADNGALKCALEARKEGKIRYIGFTGHNNPDLFLEMLGKDFEWASVQMPVNVMDAHYRSFQHMVLPELNRRKIGVLGMKSLGGRGGMIARELEVDAGLLRRYALSMPVSCLVSGIQSQEELRQMIDIGRNFKPLSDKEVKKLLDTSSELARNGDFEWYKSINNKGCSWYRRNFASG